MGGACAVLMNELYSRYSENGMYIEAVDAGASDEAVQMQGTVAVHRSQLFQGLPRQGQSRRFFRSLSGGDFKALRS